MFNLLERQVDKINRQVHFMYAQVFNPSDTTGANNTWLYNRAPDGYKFVLHSIDVSGKQEDNNKYGIVAMYDGHEYTHWNIYPGVESRELIWRGQMNDYIVNCGGTLNGWECKEYTLAIRSTHVTYPFKCCIIVWYFLQKMTWLEKLQYAVIQAKGERIRKGGPTTVERSEEDG